MNSAKIIFIGITLNMLFLMINGMTGTTDTLMNTMNTTVMTPYTTDNTDSAQSQLTTLKQGGTKNGEQVGAWQWLTNQASTILGAVNNVWEGLIQIALFGKMFFTAMFGAVFSMATAGIIAMGDANPIIKMTGFIIMIVGFIVNFMLVKEFYNIIINRKWTN